MIIGYGSVLINQMEPQTSEPQMVLETCVDVDDDETKVCAICIEEVDAENEDVRKLTCGHEFHLHCITPVVVNSFLARKDVICPMCRNVECRTTSMTYQSAYNSLIDLVRSEGRDDVTFGDVRVNIESLQSLQSLQNLQRLDSLEGLTPAHDIPSRRHSDTTEYWCSVRQCMTFLWCGNLIVLSIGFVIMIIVFMNMRK